MLSSDVLRNLTSLTRVEKSEMQVCTCESARWSCRPAEGNEGLVPRFHLLERRMRMTLLVIFFEGRHDHLDQSLQKGANLPTMKFSPFALLQR